MESCQLRCGGERAGRTASSIGEEADKEEMALFRRRPRCSRTIAWSVGGEVGMRGCGWSEASRSSSVGVRLSCALKWSYVVVVQLSSSSSLGELRRRRLPFGIAQGPG